MTKSSQLQYVIEHVLMANGLGYHEAEDLANQIRQTASTWGIIPGEEQSLSPFPMKFEGPVYFTIDEFRNLRVQLSKVLGTEDSVETVLNFEVEGRPCRDFLDIVQSLEVVAGGLILKLDKISLGDRPAVLDLLDSLWQNCPDLRPDLFKIAARLAVSQM